MDAGRNGAVSADWVPKVLGCLQQVAGDTASARKYCPKEFLLHKNSIRMPIIL